MNRRRTSVILTAAVALCVGLILPGVPEVSADRGNDSSGVKRPAKADKVKKKKRRRRRARRGRFRGHAVRKANLRTEPLPQPSGDIWIYAVNFREEVRVNIYDDDGGFDEAALAALDRGFRCRRTREVRAVDPRLYEILSIISDHFGKRRIELVSGFRFQRNEGSRHFHASAMDIRIPGVSSRELFEFAESLDRGGMGIGRYPRSGFVHIDFRAPGDPSYRWVDTSGPGSKGRGKRPSRAWRRPSS